MTGPVTFEIIALMSAVVAAAFAVWWRIETRIRSVEQLVATLRIEIMRDYASVSHLEKVERRLVDALRDLTTEVKQLRESWPVATKRRTRTSSR